MAGSKFAGLGTALRAPGKPAAAPTLPNLPPATSQPSTGRRKPGKRSNPDYEPTTLLLRTETKRLASRKLEDEGSDLDLSDLVEQLLRAHLA